MPLDSIQNFGLGKRQPEVKIFNIPLSHHPLPLAHG